MLDSEKVELIEKMVGDFLDFLNEEQQEVCAIALVAAIYSVTNFKRKD